MAVPSPVTVMATIVIRASGSGVHARDGYNSHPRVGQCGSCGPRASRGSAIVVMEPPENGDPRDAALGLARTRNRLLLRESLVRTRLVVEAHELGDEATRPARRRPTSAVSPTTNRSTSIMRHVVPRPAPR